jgi:hypothetical protein
MKLFHKWEDVYDVKTPMFVCIDETFTANINIKDFSIFTPEMVNVEHPKDFFSMDSDKFVYIAFKRDRITNVKNKIFVFKTKKLYKFERSWCDELGSIISEYGEFDIWYDQFLFIHEKDYDQAVRYLKLKRLNVQTNG